MNAQTGAITFVSAPDFENPTDSDRNNAYIVRVKATSTAGIISTQTLTVTIANVDEVDRRLAQVAVPLRDGLRGYAAQGLSDMLSFNESLMLAADSYNDNIEGGTKPLWGGFNANQLGTNARLNYGERLTDHRKRYQIFVHAGATYSKAGDDWNARLFASARIEAKVNADLFVGLNALASRSNDQMPSFDESAISDNSRQLALYARYRMSKTLRAGVFAGVGSSHYDFALSEADGFALSGTMQGHRQVLGAMLSGDIDVGGITLTTDAVFSHAAEHLGNARLSAQYLGEDRSDIAFAVGTVDVTRISVPMSAPIRLAGTEDGVGGWSKLLLAGGLLCEDNVVTASAMTCGYQMRVKLLAAQDGNNRFYADANWESVSAIRRSVFAVGYARRFGPDQNLELGLELNQRRSSAGANGNAVMLELKVVQ
jgi:hypothetical protein